MERGQPPSSRGEGRPGGEESPGRFGSGSGRPPYLEVALCPSGSRPSRSASGKLGGMLLAFPLLKCGLDQLGDVVSSALVSGKDVLAKFVFSEIRQALSVDMKALAHGGLVQRRRCWGRRRRFGLCRRRVVVRFLAVA